LYITFSLKKKAFYTNTRTLPFSMYFPGNSSRVRVMTYAGEGKIIYSEIKSTLHWKMLKLSAIEEDLNNSPGFPLPVPTSRGHS